MNLVFFQSCFSCVIHGVICCDYSSLPEWCSVYQILAHPLSDGRRPMATKPFQSTTCFFVLLISSQRMLLFPTWLTRPENLALKMDGMDEDLVRSIRCNPCSIEDHTGIAIDPNRTRLREEPLILLARQRLTRPQPILVVSPSASMVPHIDTNVQPFVL